MRIDIVSLFPALVAAVAEHGVTGRTVERGLLQLQLWNPRDYALDAYRSVDDRPYGGGPGMVMTAGPLRAAIAAARAAAPGARVIYLSPQGRPLTQPRLREAATQAGLILLAGRYEGVDERVIELDVDEEWSLGDYVISGGELAAMVVVDGIARLLPGALGHAASAEQDSFSEGLLDHPHYTRPEEVAGRRVPEVLTTGDHAAIDAWRRRAALLRTWQRRPDLLAKARLTDEERAWLAEQIGEKGAAAAGDTDG